MDIISPPVQRVTKKSVQKKPTATLQDMRHALERHHTFAIGAFRDHSIAFVLCTGILVFLQLAILSAMGEQMFVRSLISEPTYSITLTETASQTQRQALLQALLALPQVEGAEYFTKEHSFEAERRLQPELLSSVDTSAFTDQIQVTLFSTQNFAAFFQFLRRPELVHVLAPNFLWELPKGEQERAAAVSSHLNALRMYSVLAVSLVAALSLVLFLAVRLRLLQKMQELKTLLLLGSDRRAVRRPFLLEASALTLLSLVAAFILVPVLSLFMNAIPATLFMQNVLWLFLLEACVCLLVASVAVMFIPLPVHTSLSAE